MKYSSTGCQLADLRSRIAATRWPGKETVSSRSQGAQLDKLKALVDYWGTTHDWRQAEHRLNALPQYVTIDGVDIHFIWVRLHRCDGCIWRLSHRRRSSYGAAAPPDWMFSRTPLARARKANQ